MKIFVSKCSGFCFGVKRAVGLTKKTLYNARRRNKKSVYSLGSLIHNRFVVQELSKKGLKLIKSPNGIKNAYCIIPSHGIDPGKIKGHKNINFVDTTCPFVFKAQNLVRRLKESGYEILILGDKNHPEIKALVAISGFKARVVGNKKEASGLMCKSKKVALVSQTTQSPDNLTQVISELIKKNFQEFRIYNTICNDVIKRQSEAAKLAKCSDLIIVVGGRNSANTKRLAEICKNFTKTCHIEDEHEIKREWFRGIKAVGIVTGASTPGEFIGRVKKKINSI